MANFRSILLNKFLSLLLLLLHLGCFAFSSKHKHNHDRKGEKSNPSSSFSFLKRIFSSKPFKKSTTNNVTHFATPSPSNSATLTSARSSQQSLVSLVQPQEISSVVADDQFFPLRNDIFPCTFCGEIFDKPHFLEQHQSVKHAVSELLDGDTAKQIVNIIFETGWLCKDNMTTPEINRILKIHNSPKILTRFEEYRELVKGKAARRIKTAACIRDERCVADGNELLRFFCSTVICDLGLNRDSSICNQQYCSVCGIIKSGFSQKLDGISTLSSSWKAHLAIPDDIEDEFKFMNVKRAMLVCRVVAGRVGCELEDEGKKEDGGPDSVVGRSVNGVHSGLDEEELLVFNPRAVLPCFVIVYNINNNTTE